MAFKFLVGTSFLIFVLSVLTSGLQDALAPQENELYSLKHDSSILELVFVGTIDGKTFFQERTTSRTWTGARSFCNTSGLELASIDSRGEIDLLRTVGNSTNFGGYYWTAARDAQVARQFSWDNSNNQPRDNISLNWRLTSTPQSFQTCARIYLGTGTYNGYLYITTCSTGSRTLCQTKS